MLTFLLACGPSVPTTVTPDAPVTRPLAPGWAWGDVQRLLDTPKGLVAWTTMGFVRLPETTLLAADEAPSEAERWAEPQPTFGGQAVVFDVDAVQLGDQRFPVGPGEWTHGPWDVRGDTLYVAWNAEDSAVVQTVRGTATLQSAPAPVRDLVGTDTGLLLLVGDTVGTLENGVFSALPELGKVAVLHRAPDGTIWAAGEAVWRKTDRWQRVLDARTPALELDQLRPPRRHGRAVAALNAGVLVDGSRTCGDPASGWPFAEVWGDCDAWIAMESMGRTFEGGAGATRVTAPPVGVALSLWSRDGRVLVGGTSALVWQTPDAFRTIATPVPARFLDVGLGTVDATAWFGDQDQLCQTSGDTPSCLTLPAKLAGDQPLAAGPDGAWVLLADGRILHYADAEPRDDSAVLGGAATALAWDIDRNLLWVVTDAALLALDGEGIRLGSWPIPPAPTGERWTLLGDDGGSLVLGSRTTERTLRLGDE